jgi:hypothetical protein
MSSKGIEPFLVIKPILLQRTTITNQITCSKLYFEIYFKIKYFIIENFILKLFGNTQNRTGSFSLKERHSTIQVLFP